MEIAKKRYFLKNGSRRNEPVVRISLDGKDVKIYNTMWDVYNDGFRASHVKEVCEHRPKRKTHGGFKWLFLSECKTLCGEVAELVNAAPC